ncbi:Mite allergen Eur m 3 [Sarcoptes scabiei]|uniref:Mite allergen Eur m 3 n=1 Tax=Sarcoptes scabiei TaxID=52283 RepID=A0A834RG82_SARSC|nr:Mite allergen Eur m 3 [Sarcoptes scabiei]
MLLKLFQSVILTAFILFGFFRSSLTITNSSEVDISQAPWTVGIVTNPSKDTEFCAGSILSSTFVVTAAQCVYGKRLLDISIHYGSRYRISSTGKWVYPKEMFFLRYRPDTWENNIALIKTETPMNLDNVTSAAIELPSLEFDPMAETEVAAYGWGATKPGSKELLFYLMNGNFSIFDRYECAKKYEKIRKQDLITEQVFCAGGKDHGSGAHIEYGDVGDPAVQNQKLVGIATLPPSAESYEYPSIFTKVGSYVLWIQQIIGL